MSKIKVSCPTCGRIISAPEKYRGKRAKCPECGDPVLIEEQAEDDYAEMDEYDEDFAAPKPARRRTTAVKTASVETEKATANSLLGRSLTVPVVTGIVIGSLVIGYFSGRWHRQYEMQSAMASVSEALAAGFGMDDADLEESENEPSIPEIPLGQTFEGDGFSIELSSVEVGRPRIKTFSGEQETTEDCLLCTFRVTNTDDRKLLNFFGRLLMGTPACKVEDDVGNAIRPIEFGSMQELIGEVLSSDDIQPGDTREHLIVFTVPPPKTESLTMTVNLPTLLDEKEGVLKFHVDRSQITGF